MGQIGTSVPKEVILKIASWLWDHGLKTDIGYEGPSKVGEQIKVAANKGARWLILAGEDELRDGNIIVRDLLSKK